MLASEARPHPRRLRRPPPGGQCWAAPWRPRPGTGASTTTLTSEMRPGGRPAGLAGGDCIDDADVPHRQDGWRSRLRGQGALHLGDVPAQLPGATSRQLDRVSRKLLARAWAAGAGPGDALIFHHLRNLRAGEGGGARPGYTGQRGALTAAGRGRWHWRRAMARLRKGRAAHFLPVGRVRHGGARGQLTVPRQRLLHP